MASSQPPILNPDTPLAFLPPSLASQFEVSRYLLTATCGMFAWDILINMRNDYKLLTKYRIAFPTVVYFLSRIASFAYIITGTVFTIGPVGNCQALQVAIGSCFAAAVPLTSLLFFFRVRAIFHNNKWVVALFTFLWLGTVAGSITVPFAISGSHIGPTDHCINTGVKPYSSSGVIISTVNDTIVFFAISWKLLSSSAIEESFKAKARTFISGTGLPVITKSLLQSGQEYYLITVAGNIVTMAMILAPASLPAVFHAMFTVPNVAIGNSMACHVYRDIKFGRITATPLNTTIPTALSGSGGSKTFSPFSAARHSSNTRRVQRDPYGLDTQLESSHDTTGNPKFGIHMSKSVYEMRDPPVPMTITLPPDSKRISDPDPAQLA